MCRTVSWTFMRAPGSTTTPRRTLSRAGGRNLAIAFAVAFALAPRASAQVIGDFEGSMDGWSFVNASGQITYSDSYTGSASLYVTTATAPWGIFRMYPIGAQTVSARLKVLSGQVSIMVCYDYAHHGHSWWSEPVGPCDTWELVSVSGPSPCNEICV